MVDHSACAIRMALAMRAVVARLKEGWDKCDYDLDFGVGVALGFATIGTIGFEGRWHYGVIGTVANLAARLCAEARPGQILIPRRLLGRVDGIVDVETVGDLSLKGFPRSITAFNVCGMKNEPG